MNKHAMVTARSTRFARSRCKVGIIALAVVCLAACSATPPVRYDVDAKASLGQYRSVVIDSVTNDLRDGGKAFQNPLNEQRLRDAISEQLTRRGLQLVGEGETPDTYVTVALGTRHVDVPDSRPSVRFGFGFGTWRPGFGSSIYVMDDPWQHYREGRITVDWFDAKTKKALWHASAEEDLTYLTRDNAEKRINAVVSALFAKFPGTKAP